MTDGAVVAVCSGGGRGCASPFAGDELSRVEIVILEAPSSGGRLSIVSLVVLAMLSYAWLLVAALFT